MEQHTGHSITLRRVGTTSVAIIAALFVIGGLTLAWRAQADHDLAEARHQLLVAERLSNMTKTTSEVLTTRLRLYAVTGDPKHKDAYFDVIKLIRAGKAKGTDGTVFSTKDMVEAMQLTPEEERLLVASSKPSPEL